MEKEYTLEKPDLMAYVQLFRARRNKLMQGRIKGAKLFWWFLIPIILAIGMVIDGGGIGVAIAFAALIGAFTLWQKWYTTKYYEIYLSEEFCKGFLSKRRIVLDKDYFVEVTEPRKAYFLWSGIEEIFQTPTHFFICPNKISGFIVPRRIFQTTEEAQAFEKELNDRWRVGKSAPQGSLLNASAKSAGVPSA